MTIHSITNHRPNDILYNKIEHDTIPQLLKQAQEKKRQKGKGNTGKEISLTLDIKNK